MANKKKRRKATAQNNMLVLRLLILVAIVLIVFEGRLIRTMFSQSQNITTTGENISDTPIETTGTKVAAEPNQVAPVSGIIAGLAGLAQIDDISAAPDVIPQEADPVTETEQIIDETINNVNVVSLQAESVDDSYFSDAVFIGDSRMEGFRNASGITQGEFLTSVGMSISAISDAKVSTSEGTITVYQGLSGRQYKKIYLMLGANDLGFYPWDEFLSTVESPLRQMHALQPSAAIYICSVIYVEESKVVSDYVTNENVIRVNDYLLQACDDLDYCYYLNLNEIFSDGYQQLISGASADGVHLNPDYLVQMLDYLKSHYLPSDIIDSLSALEEESEAA